MHSESTRLSIAILRAVLAGETYDTVAADYHLTRTAIEHRVKRLARLLQRQVGIDGFNPEATGYVHKLRAHKDDVEAALVRFEAGELRPPAQPQILTDKDVWTVIRRAGLRSPMPLRDMALIHIVLATGARPLEVARLEIGDYLNPDGSVRSCSEMRTEVSVNRKPRPLFSEFGGHQGHRCLFGPSACPAGQGAAGGRDLPGVRRLCPAFPERCRPALRRALP